MTHFLSNCDLKTLMTVILKVSAALLFAHRLCYLHSVYENCCFVFLLTPTLCNLTGSCER